MCTIVQVFDSINFIIGGYNIHSPSYANMAAKASLCSPVSVLDIDLHPALPHHVAYPSTLFLTPGYGPTHRTLLNR